MGQTEQAHLLIKYVVPFLSGIAGLASSFFIMSYWLSRMVGLNIGGKTLTLVDSN